MVPTSAYNKTKGAQWLVEQEGYFIFPPSYPRLPCSCLCNAGNKARSRGKELNVSTIADLKVSVITTLHASLLIFHMI